MLLAPEAWQTSFASSPRLKPAFEYPGDLSIFGLSEKKNIYYISIR
jgi:hypothetical protein